MSGLVPEDIKLVRDAEELVEIASKNPPVKLLDLQTPDYGNDPNELIKHRFLYRGGIMVLTGPTGAGKSSFTMQFSVSFAGGAGLFGFKIGDMYYKKGLRILVIQAENDEGDLAEQRDGVLSVLPDDVIERAADNLSFVTMPDASGEAFAARLRAHCEVHQPDIVFIDPVFSFLGGDNNAQKDVSNWVRNLILPILMEYKCAAILIHHNNKPQKDAIRSGAYTMAGSAEWANAARCVVTLEPVADGVYALSAVKRGDRLGWKDQVGDKTLVRYIAYHGGEDAGGRPIIAWRDATDEEIADAAESSVGQKKKKTTVSDVVDCMPTKDLIGHGELVRAVMKTSGIGERTVRSHIKEALELGLITEYKAGKTKAYVKNEIN